jgi:hypothetical protein
MSSPTPVQIGSFCADFVIRDPPVVDYPGANDGAYYRRIDPTTNKMYYLAINASDTIVEVENPMESTTLTINNFKLKLNWNRTLLPVYESSKLTPINELRYLSCVHKTAYGSSSMVKISPIVDNPTEIMMRAATTTTVPNSSAISLSQFSDVSGKALILTYTQTPDPPTKVTRVNELVYLVDDADDNNTVVTSTATKRYLIVNPTIATATTPPIIGFINLYEPRVTEGMVDQTLYRINKKTSLENSLDVTYSIDVFRSSMSGTRPLITAPINYREINLDNRTGVAIGTVVDTGGSFAGTQVTHNSRTYVVAKQIADKSIAELYGELSLGLFKKFPLQTNPTDDLHLGYDCATPIASCASPTLVLRQYHNFLNPVNSAQFRMYDLGNREYMILVTEPLTTPPRRLMMKPDSTGALRFTNVTAIKEERGWHLEDAGGGHKVRLRWNYPESPVPGAGDSAAIISANYLQISEGTTPNPTMAVQGSATIFVCIKCTHIDEQTGTCAKATSILIDEDMNYLSSPTWSTPVSINKQAPTSFVNQDLKFQRGSDSLMMSVSDDGDVSFDATGSSFFTTNTGGIMTIEQRRAGVVFIGRTTTASTGEYLYAKYTGGTMEFVAATNPNVGDGFGWVVDVAQNSIRWVSPTSSPVAAASPVIPLNSQITRIITTFSASLGTYDKETDKYQIDFAMAKLGATFSSTFNVTSGTGSLTYISGNGTSSAIVSIDATRPPGSSPTNCVGGSPSPSVTRQTTRSVTISANIDGASVSSDTVTVTVPEGPCPTVITAPSTAPTTTTTTATFNGFDVSHMDSNGPVTITLRPTGSPGSAAPAFTHQQQLTYGTGNLQLTGLSVDTRYAAPMFSFMNSISKKQVGVTLRNGFQTSSTPAVVVNAVYMNGGAAGRQFYLKVGTQYAKINLNAGNIDNTGNRFWQTTDKSQASTFTIDTTKTYSADSTYKTIRLAAYYDGTRMVDYSTGSTAAAYLRHSSNWVYKSAYSVNTSVDFHWKFEDDAAGGGMKIRNPLSSYNAGLYFTDDTDTIVRLRTASPFTLAQTFTVEFRDSSSVVSPVGGGVSTNPVVQLGSAASGVPYVSSTRNTGGGSPVHTYIENSNRNYLIFLGASSDSKTSTNVRFPPNNFLNKWLYFRNYATKGVYALVDGQQASYLEVRFYGPNGVAGGEQRQSSVGFDGSVTDIEYSDSLANLISRIA